MKGITPVIAIILLMIITISMVGFAFLWFNRVMTSTTESLSNQTEAQVSAQGKIIRIENIDTSTDITKTIITIRDSGTSNIKSSEMSFFVDNQRKNGCKDTAPGGTTTWTLIAGSFVTCEIVGPSGAAVSCNDKVVKVVTPGNTDVATCPII